MGPAAALARAAGGRLAAGAAGARGAGGLPGACGLPGARGGGGPARGAAAAAAAAGGLLAGYQACLEAAPLATKAATSGVIFGASDALNSLLLAQRQGVRGGGLDLARSARFAAFGAAVQAPLFSAYFSTQDALVDGALGDSPAAAVLVKLALDQLVWTPFFWLPVFFGGMALLEGRGAQAALGVARDRGWGFTETCRANWAVWVPVNLLTYSVVPLELRILWVNSVSLLWTAYLSRVQQEPPPPPPPSPPRSAKPGPQAKERASPHS